MPEIIERAFTGQFGGTARGMRLRNEEFIRPLSFGANWSKLRIVLNVGVNDGLNIVNALIDVGVCSGTLRGIGSNNPVNNVGSGIGGGGAARYAANRLTTSSVTGGWFSSSGQRHFTAQHGSVVDSYATDNVGTFYFGTTGALNGVYRRQLFILDIQRVSSRQCLLANYVTNAAAVQCDVAEVTMVQMCETPFNTTATLASAWNLQSSTLDTTVQYSFPTATSVAWDEANGPLNALNIAWSSTAIPCIIWGIAVARYQ